jgi:hypothetical protein
MFELTLDEVRNRAGIYQADSELEADLKLAHWVGRQKYRVISRDQYQTEAPQAQADGVEILIIKEK